MNDWSAVYKQTRIVFNLDEMIQMLTWECWSMIFFLFSEDRKPQSSLYKHHHAAHRLSSASWRGNRRWCDAEVTFAAEDPKINLLWRLQLIPDQLLSGLYLVIYDISQDEQRWRENTLNTPRNLKWITSRFFLSNNNTESCSFFHSFKGIILHVGKYLLISCWELDAYMW